MPKNKFHRIIFLFAIMVVGPLCAQKTVATNNTPISSLAGIHALSNAEASQKLAVRFEATVTYYRDYEATLFVQDGDLAVFVQPASTYKLAPGDRIRIEGTTKESFRPIILATKIEVLRHGPLPTPSRATYAEMANARFDCRFVSLRGIVRSVQPILSTGRPITLLELLTDGGYVDITIDNADSSRVENLLDTEVQIAGAQSGRFDGRMEQTGILIHVNSLDQMNVLRPAQTDPWSIPITPMDEILKAYRLVDRSQRVRVEGTLTYYYPGVMAILQDGQRTMRILTPEIIPLHVGERAEATGLPMVDDDFLTLRLGSVRTLGPAPELKPEILDWDEIASGKHAFNLVSINGRIVTQVRQQTEDVYIISSGGHLFPAIVRHPFSYDWNANHRPPPAMAIAPDSSVRVTGIVLLENGNPFTGTVAFTLQMRSAKDLAVLDAPSWWTVQHLTYVALLLLGLFLATISWGWTLNRKVRRQTAALTESIETEAAMQRQNAQLESKRGKILEQISLGEPLANILEQITELVSSWLDGIACWCELESGASLGAHSAVSETHTILQCDIPSRTGTTLGRLFLALPSGTEMPPLHHEALLAGARLATLAIETRTLYSDLVHRSEFDLLTDVPNRFALEKQLALCMDEARANASVVGLIYLDLDDFKQVNDRFGHRTGDLYLKEVANRIKHQLRCQDFLARLGGDEFAVVVPAVRSRAQVEEIASRLDHCFKEPFLIEQHSLAGQMSFGVALYPDDGTTTDALLRVADSAMYKAKRNKREHAALGSGSSH